MPTIKREDGSQFVIQPYRKLLNPEKASALKRKIRLLAQKQGENVRLYKLEDGKIEAVFSRDQGFLLGETLWNFLDKPDNLIYCEALPERRQALLVIIKNKLIHIDDKMSFSNLVEEFITISSNDEVYDVYTYGEVPLVEKKSGGKFVFPEKNVKSFTVLDVPFLSQLTIDENSQLQPLELALSSSALGKSKIIPIAIGIISIIFIIIFWSLLKTPVEKQPKIQKQKIAIQKKTKIPYQEFYTKLTTPAPNKQLRELVSVATIFGSLSGWEIKSINYNGKDYNIKIKSTGGSITQAQFWAKMNNIKTSLMPDGLSCAISSELKNRTKPISIYPLQQTIASLIDEINTALNSKSVTFSRINSFTNYKSADVTIKLEKIIPGLLMFIGEKLNSFPVSINKANVNFNNNLFSGNITLQVLGD